MTATRVAVAINSTLRLSSPTVRCLYRMATGTLKRVVCAVWPQIKEIVARLKRAWAGTSYDLLQRNCCHFCEQLCAELGVPPPPGGSAWLMPGSKLAADMPMYLLAGSL